MAKKNLAILAMLLTLTTFGTASARVALEAPCIDAPYGWQYQDDTRSIVINRVSEPDLTYFVADVQLSQTDGFQTLVSDTLAPVSELASQAGAILAINGDDCGTHKFGIIIRNGELLRTHGTTRNLLILDQAGNMTVKTDRKGEDSKALGKQLLNEGVWQTFEFGPELVRDGAAVAFSPAFDVISTRDTQLEPRTAIGQIGPLHYLLIVVDGRQPGYSSGISLQNLQQLFLRYGATTAMNLDGGGSAEIWFRGQILNNPSGGEERSVTDILCF